MPVRTVLEDASTSSMDHAWEMEDKDLSPPAA
jgi:hypothetical protein